MSSFLPSTFANYRGRFAPSPTGPLHFGSLIAALGSALEAQAQGGQWLLRMEDIDTPRNIPGAADEILRQLEAFGFAWYGEVLWQSQRIDAYREALDRLKESGFAYPCACSRKQVSDAARRTAVDGAPVYGGTCREGLPSGAVPRAWRLRVEESPVSFGDAVQGPQIQYLTQEVGDFVLLRADGLFAYQLAVVVDDAEQGITQVVRGADLLDSTPRQIWLQNCLEAPTPGYAHLPVVTNLAGEKLSKQTRAEPLDTQATSPALWAALDFLGQVPPDTLRHAPVSEIWAWARAHWHLERVPQSRAMLPRLL